MTTERMFVRGDIIKMLDWWGVVKVGQLPPVIDFWLGVREGWDTAHTDLIHFHTKTWFDSKMRTFPHDYAGIPDEVLARATMYKLSENV